VHVRQRQLDEFYAVIRALKTGEIREDDVLKRLEGARPWVWTALDPVSKVLLAIAGGPRPVAMAQRVGHQVAQRFASSGMPRWLSDGFTGDRPAILGHCGVWPQPERTPAQGPVPKPRWLPLPGLLEAQGVKQSRRKRMVGVKHRVGFGTMGAIEQVVAVCGWKITTALVERLTLAIRQRVAAIGRRVTTLGQDEDGWQPPLAFFHVSHNFVLPHASLRPPLPVPEPTHGPGSAKVWRPCTPALAAGWTNHVWTRPAVLRSRVPPWPQPQALEATRKHEEREGERARGAYGQGARLGGGLGNPIGEVRTVRLRSRERLQTGPAALSAGLGYTTCHSASSETRRESPSALEVSTPPCVLL
jgi:hypothetical protein